MLLGRLSELTSDPMGFLYDLTLIVCALVVGITVHEFNHAFVAHKRGDETAGRMGRLTLNPMAHLDPLGTVMLFVAGFGWGKAVPVDLQRMKSPLRFSFAVVSLAGITANLALAATVAMIYRLIAPYASIGLMGLLETLVFVNVLLAIFNLIPIPPLDGFNFVTTLLPEGMVRAMSPVTNYGPFLLFGLLIIDGVLPISILSYVAWPIWTLAGAMLG